ncbi:hypothetical protein B5M09_006081 [Aphanomyces astaci]|uniref:Multidrug resistance-associated protein 1 n=2 Tax=Aphanomyces astaci TaxID=112090 RepID=A0A3R7Y8R3_APHAT|nr:hypothetical protein B5M09_006081 [Aphanomyces astaci]
MASIKTIFSGLQSPPQGVGDVKTAIHPRDASGFLSASTFSWCNRLISVGNERQLAPSDIWELQDSNKVGPLLQQYLAVYHAKHRGLLRAFFSIYKWKLVVIAVMQVVSSGCDLFGPAYVLPQVILTVSTSNWTRGVVLVVALFFVQMLSSLLKSHMNFMSEVIGIQFTACLRSMLFEKALKLSSKARKDKTAGDIANLFSVDVVNVMGLSANMNMAWIVPIQVGVTLYLIQQQVGWAIWAGFLALFSILMLSGGVGVFAGKAQRMILTCKDNRMKVINELFGAIQIVKLHAWEEKLTAAVTELRRKELDALWLFVKTILVLITSVHTAPVLITVVVFATYAMWMGQLLTVTIVFTTLALFENLQAAFTALPMVFVATIQALVSVKRITFVLDMHETNPDNLVDGVVEDVHQPVVIRISDGEFGWEKESPLFKNLQWSIRQGEFVVVHGAVGSGKSSLCSILLGEMDKYDGNVVVAGRVAYVGQQSWIQNATIRHNILFGRPYDHVRYRKVLDACALSADLSNLPANDRTEIGLRGVTLSGGQKARVSLARACYADADIYILDAPLSAVDAIVANEIFTKCFQNLLKHKTVVLATHNPDIIHSSAIHRSFHIQDGSLVEDRPVNAMRLPHLSMMSSPTPSRDGFWDGDEDVSIILGRPVCDTVMPSMLLTPRRRMSAAGQNGQNVLTVDEDRACGRVSQAVVTSYMSAIGGWPAVAAMVGMSLVTEAVRLSKDLWLTGWTNQSNSTSSSQDIKVETRYNMTIYAVLVLATCTAMIAQFGTVLVVGLRGSKRLFERMWTGLMASPMRFFDTNPIGRILNRCGDDVFQCDLMLPMSMAPILSQTAAAVGKVALSVGTIQWMALVLPPLVFVYVKLGSYFIAPLREVNRIKKVTLSPLLTLVSEGVDGAIVIRAFGLDYQRRFYRLHDVAVENYSAASFASASLNQWFALRVAAISNSIVLVILLGCVVMSSSISAGILGLIVSYGLTIPANLAKLVNLWANLETALIAPERLHEYATLPSEGRRDTPFNLASWPTHGRITYTNVSFRYKPDDPLVLENVSFDVSGGEKIGIVGRTGAGKSSLIMTLFRINDVAAGEIAIDGVDIATIGLKQLRSSLAIIPQNPVLFKGPLRTYMDPFHDFTDDQLWAVLKKVHLTDRIVVSDAKLEQEVDENGENFSVGERQMLCLSRALLHNAKIVMLDEATAAIDHATDKVLQKVIREELKTSTVLTIAHRLDTVLDYDRIFVFEQGQLVQNDTPAVLATQGGIFFDMIAQGGGYAHRFVQL